MPVASRPCSAQLGDLLVVVGRAEDRLLEDRRVRGDAAQRVLAHQALELAGLDQAAPDLVEPDAGAGRGQGGEPLVDSCADAHLLLLAPPAALDDRLAPLGHLLGGEAEVLVQVRLGRGGAEGRHADRVAVLGDPAVPAKRRRRPRRDTRARTSAAAPGRGSPRPARRSGRGTGAETTRVATPSASSRSAASVQMCTSEPVPIRIRSGSPCRSGAARRRRGRSRRPARRRASRSAGPGG